MKKAIKILGAVCAILLTATLVSATLLSYFGSVQTTVNVQQSIDINGHPYDEPVTYIIPDAHGGNTYDSEDFAIVNHADDTLGIFWSPAVGTPDLLGITVTVEYDHDGVMHDLSDVYTLPVGGTIATFHYQFDPDVFGDYTITTTLVLD